MPGPRTRLRNRPWSTMSRLSPAAADSAGRLRRLRPSRQACASASGTVPGPSLRAVAVARTGRSPCSPTGPQSTAAAPEDPLRTLPSKVTTRAGSWPGLVVIHWHGAVVISPASLVHGVLRRSSLKCPQHLSHRLSKVHLCLLLAAARDLPTKVYVGAPSRHRPGHHCEAVVRRRLRWQRPMFAAIGMNRTHQPLSKSAGFSG